MKKILLFILVVLLPNLMDAQICYTGKPVTIDGNLYMGDANGNPKVLLRYYSGASSTERVSFTIPDGVTEIAPNAIRYDYRLDGGDTYSHSLLLDIPSSVTKIYSNSITGNGKVDCAVYESRANVSAIAADSDAIEVARYNLQGIPISENEKGIQIIVYSDYTTKTVINE